MGYLFEAQEDGVEFLKGIDGLDVSRHGLNHLYTAEPFDFPRTVAFVATNGEMCLVDEGKPELKKYHDKIKEGLQRLRC
jgi:hypothetical protein